MKILNKMTVSAILLTIFSSCVSMTAVKPKPSDYKSIIDTLKAYSKASEAGLINPRLLLPSDGETKIGGYRGYSKWWCTYSDKSELNALVKKHCLSLGGAFYAPWCVSRKSEPLYKILIGGARLVDSDAFCTGAKDIGVIAVEGDVKDEKWLFYAHNTLGYVTPSERQARKELAKALRDVKRKIALEKRRDDAKYMMENRGTKICKVQGTIRYIGYVEDANNHNGKIKINIADAVVINSRYEIRPGGFHPLTIWDSAMNWSICK